MSVHPRAAILAYQAPGMGQSWRKRAACAGRADLMDDPQREGQALAVCARCPVEQACRDWVMSLARPDDPGGVVGRLTEKGRKRYQKKARMAATVARKKAS